MEDSIQFSIHKKPSKYGFWRQILAGLVSALLIIGFIFVIGYIIFSFQFTYFPVKGISMQPFINPNITVEDMNHGGDGIEDGVYVKRHADINYNDVVVIQKPNEDYTIIKRVIALEGDKISIQKRPVKDGQNEYRVIIKRKGASETAQPEVLQESYVKSYEEWSLQSSISWETNPEMGIVQYEGLFFNHYLNGGKPSEEKHVVAENGMLFYELGNHEVFYLGDNRSVSLDARVNGPCKTSDVIGVVKIIIRDIRAPERSGMLWWYKFTSVMDYIFGEIGDYFAWNY